MRYLAAALFVVLLAAPGSNAAAQPFPRGGDGGPIQSLDNIIMNIRQSFPGQVSDVQGPAGGRYRVKWLTPDGRVLWVIADARTGRILGVEGGGGQGNFGPRNFGPQNFGPPNFVPRDFVPPNFGDRGVRQRPFENEYGPGYGGSQPDDNNGARQRPRWNRDGDDFPDRRGRFYGR